MIYANEPAELVALNCIQKGYLAKLTDVPINLSSSVVGSSNNPGDHSAIAAGTVLMIRFFQFQSKNSTLQGQDSIAPAIGMHIQCRDS